MAGTRELQLAIDQLREANAAADIVLISHPVNRTLYRRLSEDLGPDKRCKDLCLVFLNTHGGDPHAAFRIARCLRYHYKAVRLIVPNVCKSAGTLIAIGADTVVIGDRGELGPLDIQIANRKEIFERSSGLDYTEALAAMLDHAQRSFRQNIIDIRAGAQMSTKMAGEFAAQLATGAVAPMYAQIDPIQVGEVYRAMKIAHEYGRRLDKQSQKLKPDALMELISGYPDHGFVIDRKEAEQLFRSVEAMTSQEKQFADTFRVLFNTESDHCSVIDGKPVQTVTEDHDADSTLEHDQRADHHAGPAQEAALGFD